MFIKRSTHSFQGTFSYFVSSRIAFEEMGAHAQEAATAERMERSDNEGKAPEAGAEKAGERDKKKEKVSGDAAEGRAEHLSDIETKRSALEKVANIITESPENIEKAFYNYNLAEHDEANRTPKLEAQRIIDKIIAAKKEGKLKGITFLYLGGTNGQRHDLNKLEKRMASEIKQWHEKKSEAFRNILKGKNTIQPVELRTFIAANEGLIKEYQAKVGAGNAAALKTFLATNNAEFCDAGGLFDLALAYQRADDLYGVMNEGKKIDPLKDVVTLDLRTGAGSEDLENCRSKLEFTMLEGATGEVQPQKPAQGKGEVIPTPLPVKGPNDLPEDHPEQLPPAPVTFEKNFTGKIDQTGRLILTVEPMTPAEGKPTTYEVIATPNIPGNPQLDIAPGKPENGHKTVEVHEKTPSGPGRLYFRTYVTVDQSGHAELVVVNNPPDKNLKPQDEKPPEFKVVPNEKSKGTFIIEVVKSTSVATGHFERAPAPAMPEAKHFNDTGIDEKKYEQQLKDATEVLKGLDIETKKILTHLTPPVFSLMNSLQPKADSNGRYFVYIDIRNTPQDIKKNLENAAKMIIEEGRFLYNTPQEDKAADHAREKGMPFKNIRQAYVEDLKNKPKINWNGPAGDPVAPYEWVEKDQKDSEWFNYAVETPAETTDRIKKNTKEEEVKRRSDDEAKKAAADEAAAKKTAIEEDANKEADPEDVSKFRTALDAYNVKREAFNQANGLKLTSHLDAFFDRDKGPYKSADIDEYAARLEGLSNGIDRFGKVFESMSDNTKNILKSVELIIDQEDEDRKDPGKNISRNDDGSYRLWFDIARSEERVKKDVISQKNKFVKGKKYKEDSPLEAQERATAGDTFKNAREAFSEKGIRYDAKKDAWIPARNRKWAGTLIYDYSTVEIPEEPIVPTPAPDPEPAPNPKPKPKPKPEPAPEVPYEAANTDSIKLVDHTIKTKQKINGINEIGRYILDNKITVNTDSQRINTPDGKVMALKISTEDNKPIGYVYLDKTGTMKAKMESGYAIRIQDKTITVSKKREL
ncbi:MAG: hypothetical protein NTX63_03060 [Candidatus Peregrinibacteria bacterium]|nr:hypothetical protein [Candidatus Peregrinibacteria bacterium]